VYFVVPLQIAINENTSDHCLIIRLTKVRVPLLGDVQLVVLDEWGPSKSEKLRHFTGGVKIGWKRNLLFAGAMVWREWRQELVSGLEKGMDCGCIWHVRGNLCYCLRRI
jgi:hypothetical protein